ncbi:hypothetical protein, partial [Nocardia wallacei]|uniref:hypothetical protein n=1 Tax=Nocardia wallacei TaxID=480035 RepID=UPI0024545CD8
QAFSFNVASISGAGAVTVERNGAQVKERREFSITGGMCPRCEGRGSPGAQSPRGGRRRNQPRLREVTACGRAAGERTRRDLRRLLLRRAAFGQTLGPVTAGLGTVALALTHER